MSEITKEQWAALAAPFDADEIELLPKYTGKKVDGRIPRDVYKTCDECGKWHPFPCVHLSYVGHAGITSRLNSVLTPENWSIEPIAFTDSGNPSFNQDGMWFWFTIGDSKKLCFGDADGKTGSNAIKEIIGDGIRNGAMRFGVGTYLWSKSDRAKAQIEHEDTTEVPETPETPEKDSKELLITFGKLANSYSVMTDRSKKEISVLVGELLGLPLNKVTTEEQAKAAEDIIKGLINDAKAEVYGEEIPF